MRSGSALLAGAVMCLWGPVVVAQEPPRPDPVMVQELPRHDPAVVPIGAKEGSVLLIEPKTVPGGPTTEEVTPPGEEKSLPETVKQKVWDKVWEVTGGAFTWINPGTGGFGMFSWETLRDWDNLWKLRDTDCQGSRFNMPLAFSMHWWSGPKGDGTMYVPDLPARVYDLYIDMNWQTRWSDWLATEFRLAPGLHTDFKVTPPDAFRLRGHAVGMVTLVPELELVLGAEYINRNRVKMLPVVGLLWQPHEDLQCRLVFPHPKVAYCFSHWGKSEFWAYVAGEYGGGTWAYKYLPSEKTDWVEYSDYRVLAGVEHRDADDSSHTFLEFGYLFERNINFVSALPDFIPKDTFLVRVGHRF